VAGDGELEGREEVNKNERVIALGGAILALFILGAAAAINLLGYF
jgi:hypothetical protein